MNPRTSIEIHGSLTEDQTMLNHTSHRIFHQTTHRGHRS